jgi:uncharacterized protein (DUF58 family)
VSDHPTRSSRRRRRQRRADAVRARIAWLRRARANVARWLTPVTDFVSPLGFAVLGIGLGSLLLAGFGDWAEFALLGYLLLAVFLVCVLLTVGRTDLHVSIALDPTRVTVGDQSTGIVRVLNRRSGRLFRLVLELPVGSSTARFNLPTLAGQSRHDQRFHIPTTRRGVIAVGPASTVRGDPFGLVHRTVRWTEQLELFVHPRIVRLGSFDSGLLRDLEGRTTTDMSVSDLAFHALREYQPGDDRRYIHWRSSAKASAGAATTTFLIRQFLDTRRSHLCVVVDADDLAYTDADDFEAAISAAASVAIRAIREEIQTTVVVGDQIVHEGGGLRTLDGFARATPARQPLAALAATAGRVAPATSIALLVTGAGAEFVDIRRAIANLPVDVATVVLRLDPSQPAGMSSTHGATVLSIGSLADLPRVLHAAATL